MEINEYIGKLQEKFGYDEQLVSALNRILPSIVQVLTKYCGEEAKNTIFNALYNCEIHIQAKDENMIDYCNEQFNENEEELNTDCKLLGAFFASSPIIENNKVSLKQFIYIPTEFGRIDFTDENKLSNLVHEMCHAIKSYNKLKINNGVLEYRSGVEINKLEYNPKTNKMDVKDTYGLGLEEGINACTEHEIMSTILGRKFKGNNYAFLTPAIEAFFRNEQTKEVIIKSSLNGDDAWIEYFGREKADKIVECCDIIVDFQYNLNYMRIPEKVEKFENARRELASIIINHSSLESVQKFKESRAKADQKTMENLSKVFILNNQTNQFEEEQVRKIG